MLTSKTIRTITDMRKAANELLRLVSRSKEPVGILKNNKLAAYLINPETLESLEAFVEDYLDQKLVAERLPKTKPGDFADFKQFWKRRDLPHRCRGKPKETTS